MDRQWIPEQKGRQEVLRRALGLVLLILLSGIWACLWVPPSGW